MLVFCLDSSVTVIFLSINKVKIYLCLNNRSKNEENFRLWTKSDSIMSLFDINGLFLEAFLFKIRRLHPHTFLKSSFPEARRIVMLRLSNNQLLLRVGA